MVSYLYPIVISLYYHASFQVREKVVFLPVEMAHRELESKILLAVELCQRGYVVKLGLKISHRVSTLDSRRYISKYLECT